MKRVVKARADQFAIVNDNGAIAVTSGKHCQILDVEGTVRSQFDAPNRVCSLLGQPYMTLGTEGAVSVVDPKGNLVTYLFPEGYETAVPTCFCYSASTTKLAVGVNDVVLVYDLNKKLENALVAFLEGHEAAVVQCAFLTYPGYEHLVITCSADCRYIVWDLNKRCMSFESPFESSYAIKGISTFETNHLFALAFEDGYVKLYDASPILEAKPSVRFVKMINATRVELEGEEEEEEPSIVISKKKPPKPEPKRDVSGEQPPAILASGTAALHGREYMLCATANSVVAVNIATFEKNVVFTFDDTVSDVIFSDVLVAAKFPMSTDIMIKRLAIGFVPEIGLQLFPDTDLPVTSPLNTEVTMKAKPTVPIATLHKKVKSSGYAKKPEQTRIAKLAAAKKPAAKKKASPEPPTVVTQFKVPKAVINTFTPHEAPLGTAALSADGKRLICSDNVGTIVFVKQKSTPAYLGHTQPVTSLAWNNTHGFISASLDKTVKFWDIDRPDPLLTMTKTKSDSRGTAFQDDITGCSYFWDDKFVLLSYGPNLSLYGYQLPSINAKAKTVADMHQAGTYKCVKTVTLEAGKIVSMAASNIPMSPIVLVATTAKTIHAVDFATGQKVLDIESQHERPIHTIIANYGGIYTPRSESTMDLALTGAMDESFKLWDLRNARCERTIPVGSRTVKVGMCFSPDSKYVALGTERLGVEIWDIGQGKCVAKLKDDLRGQTISWLQWNPSSGRLQCGTENGVIKILG